MKIVISLLNFRPGRIGGTETYLRRLIPRMFTVAGQHELTLLVDRQQEADNLFPAAARAVVNMNPARVLVERGLEAVSQYRSRSIEQLLERLQPDVAFFPQQSIFPKHVDCPCVLTVHDLYHVHMPRNLTPQQRLFRNGSYASSIERADRIIAISQFTKDSAAEHYGYNPERISVVPHGVETEVCEPAPCVLAHARPYLYYPATTLPHKNHAVLFQTIAQLKASGRFDYDLILSGLQTKHWKSLRRLIDRLGMEETVRHLGFVSYDQVQRLYREVQCILFPTTFEGFGLPIVEAYEAKKKIIVSRLDVFSELGVPERFQIDFGDPNQLDAALRLPWAMPLMHRPWTWQEAARATLDLLVKEARGATPCILPFRRSPQFAAPIRHRLRRAA